MSAVGKSGATILKILGVLAILMVATMIAIPLLLDANQFRPTVESELSQALGREVKIGNLKLSLFSGGIAADNIVIADDGAFSRTPFVQAKSLRIGVEIAPLIFSKLIRMTAIELEQPEIALFRSASGVWNFSTIGGKPSPGSEAVSAAPAGMDLCIGKLNVNSGRITLITAGESRQTSHVYDNVNISAQDVCLASSFPFSLISDLPGGGKVALEGRAGPLNLEDASLTAVTASIDVTRFDLTASGFVEPDAGLAGLFDFKGELASDGKTLKSQGNMKADKIQMVKGGKPAAQPVTLEYTADYDLKNQSGTLSRAEVRLAEAAAVLQGNYALQGNTIVLDMKLQGENMPAEDLEAMLPPLGITLPQGSSLQGGMLNLDLQTEGTIEKMVTTGSLDISNVQISGFDLGKKMGAIASLVGIPSSPTTQIEKFASEVRIVPDGIEVGRLSLIVPALGELSGSGAIGSDSTLDFKMLARLNSGVAGIMKKSGIPFFIRGTTANPSFIPDAKGVASSLLDSVMPARDGQGGGEGSGKNLGDALRGLFGSKK